MGFAIKVLFNSSYSQLKLTVLGYLKLGLGYLNLNKYFKILEKYYLNRTSNGNACFIHVSEINIKKNSDQNIKRSYEHGLA